MLATAHEKDKALIYEVWDGYASALTAGDMERWISLWIRGGIEMTDAGLLFAGAEQIRAAWQPVMDLFDMEMIVFPKDVRILGDHAHLFGSYKHVITPKEGGESISDTGLFLTILERQTDGSWKIAIACFNNNAPPDPIVEV